MNEVWKPVSGYEASYEVSNTGKVRSIDRSITTSENMIHAYRTGLQTKGRYPIKKYRRADDATD